MRGAEKSDCCPHELFDVKGREGAGILAVPEFA